MAIIVVVVVVGAALGHLALQDGDGALDHADRRHELLLLGDEVRVLLL